jgi:cytochrome c553
MSLFACRDEKPPQPAPEPPAPVATTPVAPPVDASDPETLKQHMWKHFTAISQLQRAIARGHLDEAKELANWIATHPELPQEGWEPYLDQLHGAALEVAGAKDLPTAATLATKLVRACSKCHEARGAIVTFAWELQPEDGPALQVQMKRHQWAAARLWDGLVGPSDELWNEGAGVLATAHLDTLQASGGTTRGDVTALAAHVRELALRAVKLEDTDARAQLYGELLSTCAGCHQIVRPKPVP